MRFEKLMEIFCFSGKEATTFDEKIGSYWNVGGDNHLPEGVVLGDQVTIKDKNYKLMYIQGTLLFIRREKYDNYIYCQFFGEPEKMREAESTLEVMSSVKIK